ncbi:MAG: MlaD family protein [Solirubrobacteraceae bacterium]|nr:MAG: hypothetical protein DLM63_11310 [Solirubrobacterales bacterium]
MRRRRGQQTALANPVLVGAVTTLVTLVAVFLAYNANNGLPFVPVRVLHVEVANGSNLTPGNDVREGGFRVGVLTDVHPVPLPDGTIGAVLTLNLDKKSGLLPTDSQVEIRQRSALGLKYVDVIRGQSRQTIVDGGTLPLAQTVVPVQFDDIFKIFDPPTRKASQANLVAFGDAFAGRGGAINQAIQSLPSFFIYLSSVARNLADPQTQIANFFIQLDRAAQTVAPIAAVVISGFRDIATTFDAITLSPQAYQQTIQLSPSTLDVGTASLINQRPFLVDFAGFGRDLSAATRELAPTLPTINSALEIAPGVLRRSVSLDKHLQAVLHSLQTLALDPNTNLALRGLTDTVNTLNPQLKYYGPYITVCNWLNLWVTYVPAHFAEFDTTGSAQRALLNLAAPQPNGIGTQESPLPASPQDALPGQTPQALHGQPFAAAITDARGPGGAGNADCENGQNGYPTRLAAGVDPKRIIVSDAHNPGEAAGPVYKQPTNPSLGLFTSRVPAGETFTREPIGVPPPPP